MAAKGSLPASLRVEDSVMAATEKNRGRRKIEMNKISDAQARRICFSKRRNGLFNKAGEFSVLCGVEIAAVVFSPAGKAFTFGSPSVDTVVDRFLGSAVSVPALAPPHIAGELNGERRELCGRLEAEKKRRKALEKRLEAGREGRRDWRTAEELESFGAEELEKLKISVEQLKTKLEQRAHQLLPAPPSSSTPTV